MGKHDSHLDSENTLTHKNMADSSIDVVDSRLAGLDHVAISELLTLGSLATNLSGHRHLSTLGARLHNESEDTVASTTDGKASQKLVLKRFGLSLCAKAAVGHALGVELDSTLREVESLLHNRGQLADSLALLAEHILGAGGLDDDLSAERSHADLNTGVSDLGELLAEQLVDLGVEHAVRHELSLLADIGGCHLGGGGK
mmetsp:Transcript_18878/g.25601  ORF Transcript_18878/g.25601 Transcript_18878/m.25601 type:complete len:200 (+) Transcript_18878:259-858(+)